MIPNVVLDRDADEETRARAEVARVQLETPDAPEGGDPARPTDPQPLGL